MEMGQGKEALTGYRIVESRVIYSLLDLDLYTGRTHQIRIHLNWLGYPVSGNRIYIASRPPVDFLRFWDSLFNRTWQLFGSTILLFFLEDLQ